MTGYNKAPYWFTIQSHCGKSRIKTFWIVIG